MPLLPSPFPHTHSDSEPLQIGTLSDGPLPHPLARLFKPLTYSFTTPRSLFFSLLSSWDSWIFCPIFKVPRITVLPQFRSSLLYFHLHLSHIYLVMLKKSRKKKSGEKFLHVWLCKHDIERGPGSSVEIMDYGVRIVRCDEEGNFESWILDPLPNGFHCARMWVWVDACSAW